MNLQKLHRLDWTFLLLLGAFALALLALPKDISRWLLALLFLAAVALILRGGALKLLPAWRTFWTATKRRRLAWVSSRLAVVLAFPTAYLFRPQADIDSARTGLVLTLVMAACWGVFALAQPHWPTWSQPIVATRQRVRWWALGAGALALLLLAEINGNLLHIGWLRAVSYHIQFGLLVAGCSLLLIAFPGIPHIEPRRVNPLLVGIILLALVVNIHYLGDAVRVWIDELHFAMMIVRLWDDPNRLLLIPNPGIPAFSSVFAYLQSMLVPIMGPELWAMRLVSVAFGTLTIPAVYLLGKSLFNRKTALLAALFLAAFPPHIHFSRTGINNIADPLFGVLALAFLVRGIKSGSYREYAISGVMLGLTQYFYEGGKLLFPALMLIWLVPVLISRRGHFRGLLILGGTFLLLAIPVYAASYGNGAPAMPRMDQVGSLEHYFDAISERGLGAFFQEHFERPILHFVHSPDESEFFYGGETGIILGYMVPLFLIGLGLALGRLGLSGWLLVLWVVGTVIGNTLIGYWVYTARYVVVFPAIALLFAVAFHWLLGRFLRTRYMIVIALLLAFPQVIYYFGPHLEVYVPQAMRYPDHIDAAYRSRDFPPETRVYIIHLPESAVYEPHYAILKRFWNLNINFYAIDSDTVTIDSLQALPRDRDMAIFVELKNVQALRALDAVFGPITGLEFSPYDVPFDRQYGMLYLPRQTQ
ncbi:MAG: glycosyltransferase family 39 protein [Anaerolineae bacterium]|nr:glycosyltransferase family 39 protein [Anaerolineae bacterium]